MKLVCPLNYLDDEIRGPNRLTISLTHDSLARLACAKRIIMSARASLTSEAGFAPDGGPLVIPSPPIEMTVFADAGTIPSFWTVVAETFVENQDEVFPLFRAEAHFGQQGVMFALWLNRKTEVHTPWLNYEQLKARGTAGGEPTEYERRLEQALKDLL